ncbi:MAG TPA: DUF4124 domain-containing protein [Gammaproteobacteria bacterium]|nr:DUF4124 domain-containing protein [Gammaproteobacteria bacterium]
MQTGYCHKLFAVFLLCAGGSPLADTYRWVDDNGQVHYTDQQRGAKSQVLKSYSNPGAARDRSQDRMEKTRKLLNAYQLERRQKREQRAAEQAAEEKRIRKCNRARDDIRRYNSYRRIYNLDQDGQRVYLSDQQRAELMQRAQDRVTRWCG